MNLEFLDCIKENVVCITDGQERIYACGSDARKAYQELPGIYEACRIRVLDGTIAVTIEDKTSEIQAANRAWMQEEKEKNGVEPGYF